MNSPGAVLRAAADRPWPRAALAAAAGALSVAGFAPLGLWPLTLAALLVLTHLVVRAATPGAAFAAGFWFGLGQFGTGVSWVLISLTRFGGMPPALAALATFGFCAVLALHPAAAAWLQARLGAREAVRALVLWPAAWAWLEWVRGWILTGFPWLGAGQAAIDTPLAGFAPLGGALLVSAATLAAGGALWCLCAGTARRAAAVVLVALAAGGQALRTVEWSRPEGAPVTAALLQGNVPQSLKFDPARYAQTLETYARLAEESRARLIVLPETAVPRFRDQVEPEWLSRMAAAARRNDGDMLLGVPIQDAPGRYTNSVVTLGSAPAQRYDKSHLVPFGEFVPPGFQWVLRWLSIPMSDFTPGAARQPPLRAAGQSIAVSVCYENAFGTLVAGALPEATLLVNVSNVAWFGDSLAPAQHLEIARMRALETGRVLLAATNTGLTAAIGHDGRVLARAPAFTEVRVELTVQGRAGSTPYARLGDALALGLAALAAIAAALAARRSRSR